MDLDVFDDVARQAANGSSRRSLVRAGLGALGLTSLGLLTIGEADAKKKNRNKKKRCKGNRPEKCGKGCCAAEYPNCCEMAGQPNASVAFICAPASFTCCPVETGGGACETGETCCAPTQEPNTAYGWCARANEACCPTDSTGRACPTGSVCSFDNACPVDYTLDGDGCCYPDAAVRVGPASRSHGTPRFIKPAR